MSRFAIIENNTVVNVVEAEAAFAETQGWIEAKNASIGWLWDGESFSAPVRPDEEIQQEIAERQEQARVEAYRNESDPIFFKYQRDEATKEEWLDKIAEIKARYPG
jgi:hypothetical protein